MATIRAPRALPSDWVELSHPDVEGTFRAPASALNHWKSRGWAPVDGSAEPATEAAANPPQPAPRRATTGQES